MIDRADAVVPDDDCGRQCHCRLHR